MFKFVLVVAVLAGIVFFTPASNSLKARIVDYVNPSAEQRSNLNTLQKQLNTLSQKVAEPSFQKLSDAEKSQQIKTLVSQASQTLDQAEETAKASDLGATISSVVNKVLPNSWTAQLCPQK